MAELIGYYYGPDVSEEWVEFTNSSLGNFVEPDDSRKYTIWVNEWLSEHRIPLTVLRMEQDLDDEENYNNYKFEITQDDLQPIQENKNMKTTRTMREMINLMEGVIAVPGLNEKSTSEKQARTMAAAAHNPEFAKKVGIDQSVAKEFNKADTGTEQLSNAMKEGTESDMQTAGTVGRNQDYAEFDQSQGMATESVPAVDSCQQTNPATADVACAMESGVSDLIYDQQYSRFSDLMNSYVEPQEAFDVLSREMAEQGIEGEEHDAIMQRLESDFFPEDSEIGDGMTDAEADADTLKSAGWGSDEDYGGAGDMEFEEAFDLRENFGSADIQNVKMLFSFDIQDDAKKEAQWMADAVMRSNPTADLKNIRVKQASSRSSTVFMEFQFEPQANANKEAYAMGQAAMGANPTSDLIKTNLMPVSPGREATEEAFDLKNGYDDINDASGNDYFPNGADSPVVSKVGPSGARQGDNPEQKKMQVAEVHKELVYGYRNYLKETAVAKKKS